MTATPWNNFKSWSRRPLRRYKQRSSEPGALHAHLKAYEGARQGGKAALQLLNGTTGLSQANKVFIKLSFLKAQMSLQPAQPCRFSWRISLQQSGL